MELSIIVPIFNEQENLPILYSKISEVAKEITRNYEIVLVNDGSTDYSLKVLRELHLKDKRVKVISFRRNFGQTAAMDAGFKFAKGKIVVTLDADLQNDPSDIPRMIEKLNSGYDVISGWRWPRRDPIAKKLFSRFADRLRRFVLDDKVHDSGCTLKVYRKEAIKNINLFGEMHRYIPAIIAGNGFRIGELKVKHHARKFGKTKYGMGRLLKGFLDLFYLKFWRDFSTRPLHFFGSVGVVAIGSGAVLGICNVLYHIFINKRVIIPVGPLQLLAALMVLAGVQLIVVGFLGEINIRTYYSKAGETHYKIREILE